MNLNGSSFDLNGPSMNLNGSSFDLNEPSMNLNAGVPNVFV
ncbi:hypothetical protein [uncultured Acetobacteroides sp.]|nr:hypothetical protein [uncultured Acetobacteroides sp.]